MKAKLPEPTEAQINALVFCLESEIGRGVNKYVALRRLRREIANAKPDAEDEAHHRFIRRVRCIRKMVEPFARVELLIIDKGLAVIVGTWFMRLDENEIRRSVTIGNERIPDALSDFGYKILNPARLQFYDQRDAKALLFTTTI